MKDELKRVYLFFLRKLSTFNELEFNEKDIDSFLRRLGKKMDLIPLGEQFAWDYVSFQFCYWAEKKHIGTVPFFLDLRGEGVEKMGREGRKLVFLR